MDWNDVANKAKPWWSCTTCHRLHTNPEGLCLWCDNTDVSAFTPSRRDRSYALHADRRAGEGWRYFRD